MHLGIFKISTEEDYQSFRKRAIHNEAEKRRIKNISNAIEEMRSILNVRK